MLRDPVERAYSEYQMKVRRVETQEEYLSDVQLASWALMYCLMTHPTGRNMSGVDSCLPPYIVDNPKWKYLRKTLGSLLKSGMKMPKAPRNSSLSGFLSRGSTKKPKKKTVRRSLTNSTEAPLHWTGCFYVVGEPPGPLVSPIIRDNAKLSKEHNLSYSKQRKERRTYLTERTASIPSVLSWLKLDDGVSLRFDVQACGSGLREFDPGLEKLVNETLEFTACADLGRNPTMQALDAAVERCVEVKHGISEQYIYRGLYAPQIYNCLKSIPREKLLILDSALLKKNPVAALKKVHAHIGVENMRYKDLETSEQLNRIFNEWYPTFETRSGWKIDGGYKEMSTPLREKLSSFYAPFNAMLFDLIGEGFDW
uniref:Sulfotransferase domain-containing protein n=1 Tax=Octactis speculum TaxID=3111310 RepID=A0A7S2B1K2_9STRA